MSDFPCAFRPCLSYEEAKDLHLKQKEYYSLHDELRNDKLKYWQGLLEYYFHSAIIVDNVNSNDSLIFVDTNKFQTIESVKKAFDEFDYCVVVVTNLMCTVDCRYMYDTIKIYPYSTYSFYHLEYNKQYIVLSRSFILDKMPFFECCQGYQCDRLFELQLSYFEKHCLFEHKDALLKYKEALISHKCHVLISSEIYSNYVYIFSETSSETFSESDIIASVCKHEVVGILEYFIFDCNCYKRISFDFLKDAVENVKEAVENVKEAVENVKEADENVKDADENVKEAVENVKEVVSVLE